MTVLGQHLDVWTLCGIGSWLGCAALLGLFFKWSIEDDPWDEWDQRSDRPYDLEDDVDALVLINHHREREVAALKAIPTLDPAAFSFRYEHTDIEPGMRLRDWRGGGA